MSHFAIKVDCPKCGEPVEMEITMDSAGEPRSWDYPGSAPEWHADDSICEECGELVPASVAQQSDKIHDEVQQTAAERQATQAEDHCED